MVALPRYTSPIFFIFSPIFSIFSPIVLLFFLLSLFIDDGDHKVLAPSAIMHSATDFDEEEDDKDDNESDISDDDDNENDGDASLEDENASIFDDLMNEAGFATDYDKVVTGRVAKILSGGGVLEPQMVSEEYVLGLEREAIYECLNDERSQARIEHMLKTGKPLRN